MSGHFQFVRRDVVRFDELSQIFRTLGLIEIEFFFHSCYDVTVDSCVLAQGDGPDEVVVKADKLLLEVQGPVVKPGNNAINSRTNPITLFTP